MRAKRRRQRSIFDPAYPDHKWGRLLADVSAQLDRHPRFLDWIGEDVDGEESASAGRAGLTCEVILRAGILMQLKRYSYRELEFQLLDSSSAKRFTRVDPSNPPKRSALNRCIGAVRART